ncbi:MAG: hypothetical protein ACJA1P_002197 [Maribacter sp.]|jgi:hypothetical protein
MIKFFRKIRQKMLTENKFSKYLIYAVGEIVLVVVGILIALSINNWNEKQINHNKLADYIRGMKDDLLTDKYILTHYIDDLEKTNLQRAQFLNHENYFLFTIDSLEKKLEIFEIESLFSDKSYQQIQNSNISDYGKYKDMIESSRVYYSIWIPAQKENIDRLNRDVEMQNNFLRYQQSSYEIRYTNEFKSYQSDEQAKKELVSLLKSPIPRNILKMDYKRNEDLLIRFRHSLKFVNDLTKEIDSTLIN